MPVCAAARLSVQLAATTLGLMCYLASNAISVSALKCRAPSTRRSIYCLSFVRWSCWNITFLANLIKVRPGCPAGDLAFLAGLVLFTVTCQQCIRQGAVQLPTGLNARLCWHRLLSDNSIPTCCFLL
jgi:hypothetical protein